MSSANQFREEVDHDDDRREDPVSSNAADQPDQGAETRQTTIPGLNEPGLHQMVTHLVRVVMESQHVKLERTKEETLMSIQTVENQINREHRELKQVQSELREEKGIKQRIETACSNITQASCALFSEKNQAEDEIAQQQLRNEIFAADGKKLCCWSADLAAKSSQYREENDKFWDRQTQEKRRLEEEVRKEMESRKAREEEHKRMKKDLHVKLPKTIEDRKIRKAHAQEVLHLATTSMQANAQQLQMFENRLEMARKSNLTRLSTKEEEKRTVENRLQTSRGALEDAKKRKDCLVSRNDSVSAHLEKQRLACTISVRQNQEQNENILSLIEEIEKEKIALNEISSLCREERDIHERNSRALQADRLRLQTSMSESADELSQLQLQLLARGKRDEGLSGCNDTLRDIIIEYDQELASMQLLNDVTKENLDLITKSMEEKKKANEEWSCLKPSWKEDLVIANNISMDLERQMRSTERRIKELEVGVNNLQTSIKSLLDQKIKKMKIMNDEQKSKCFIMNDLQRSERLLKDLFRSMTDTLAENCRYQEKLNELIITTERDGLLIASMKKLSSAKADELKVLETKIAALKEVIETLDTRAEESEQKTEDLTAKLSDKEGICKELKEKVDSKRTLQSLIHENISSLTKIIKDQDEMKIKIEEKRAELSELESKAKQRQTDADEKRKKLVEETERVKKEFSETENKKVALKTKHEEVIFQYDSMRELWKELEKEKTDLRMEIQIQEGKLASAKRSAEDAKVAMNDKIKTIRLQLNEFRERTAESVRQREEDINVITSKLNSIKMKIAHVEKRKMEGNTKAEMASSVKSILKQPAKSPQSHVEKRTVRFAEPVSFVHVLVHASESQENVSPSTDKKRKRRLSELDAPVNKSAKPLPKE